MPTQTGVQELKEFHVADRYKFFKNSEHFSQVTAVSNVVRPKSANLSHNSVALFHTFSNT